jgi:hypothetical protein
MPQIMTSLASFASQYAKPLSALATTAGAGANVYSGIKNAQNTSAYNSTQSYIQNLMKNPQAAQKAAAAYTQPLSAGLTDSVTNQVQAQLAERGLGGSPAALQTNLAQALAPYIQQNQQTGMSSLMQMLNAGGSARPANLPNVDLSKLMASLKMPGGGSTSDPTNAMVQTGFADMQMPEELQLDQAA